MKAPTSEEVKEAVGWLTNDIHECTIDRLKLARNNYIETILSALKQEQERLDFVQFDPRRFWKDSRGFWVLDSGLETPFTNLRSAIDSLRNKH